MFFLGSFLLGANLQVAAEDPTTAFLELRVKNDPDDLLAWNRLGGVYLAALRRDGDLANIPRARNAADESLRIVPAALNPAGLGLRAKAALAAHRFAEARADALSLAGIAPAHGESWLLLGDVCFEQGDYSEAERAWGELARLEPDASATQIRRFRMAFLRGDRVEASRCLDVAIQASEAIGPPAADLVAWCYVQRGYLDFTAGATAAAELKYRAALAAWPGWYVAEDHLAEAMAARGDYAEAIGIYETLVERVRRPELWQAYGEVLKAAGRVSDATVWQGRALEAYRADVAAGGASYYHHLAGFYADVQRDPAEALRWASQDFELRRSVAARDALGWALYLNGKYAEALTIERNALDRGTRDAHILFHAALIASAAGVPKLGGEYLRAAIAINPRCNGFHVHR
ncbi:hypothetical protein IMCC26134_09075 [Verrucomicrobia bacterium IMCC26134]|nr:hypothetical protein IMCC26134_09075 [Verrucomicrobia bacterium IMCC26134]